MGRNLKFCSEVKVGETDTNWCLLRVAVQAHMVMRICLYGEPPSLVQMTQLGKVNRSSFEPSLFLKAFLYVGMMLSFVAFMWLHAPHPNYC
jgi:hypothetical protein